MGLPRAGRLRQRVPAAVSTEAAPGPPGERGLPGRTRLTPSSGRGGRGRAPLEGSPGPGPAVGAGGCGRQGAAEGGGAEGGPGIGPGPAGSRQPSGLVPAV